MQTTVLYHAACPDGFGAALACWLKFGDDAQYIPVKYGDGPPYSKLSETTDLYIVDFSYSAEELRKLVIGRTVRVIDHHKTAQAALADLHHGRIQICFDLDESGATLTWKQLFDEDVPVFFQYLRDRDLWRWEMPQSKEVSAALRSYPTQFDVWASFIGSDCTDLAAEGVGIVRHIDKLATSLAYNHVIAMVGGYHVPCVNTGVYGSEIGNYICEKIIPEVYHDLYPFAACFSLQKNDMWRWELRSIGEFDVSEVAKMYGGGGHKNAAGFLTETNLLHHR